jgi:hypothetical protein
MNKNTRTRHIAESPDVDRRSFLKLTGPGRQAHDPQVLRGFSPLLGLLLVGGRAVFESYFPRTSSCE